MKRSELIVNKFPHLSTEYKLQALQDAIMRLEAIPPDIKEFIINDLQAIMESEGF